MSAVLPMPLLAADKRTRTNDLLKAIGVFPSGDREIDLHEANQNYLIRIKRLHAVGEHHGPEAVKLNGIWNLIKERLLAKKQRTVTEFVERQICAQKQWNRNNPEARRAIKKKSDHKRWLAKQQAKWDACPMYFI